MRSSLRESLRASLRGSLLGGTSSGSPPATVDPVDVGNVLAAWEDDASVFQDADQLLPAGVGDPVLAWASRIGGYTWTADAEDAIRRLAGGISPGAASSNFGGDVLPVPAGQYTLYVVARVGAALPLFGANLKGGGTHGWDVSAGNARVRFAGGNFTTPFLAPTDRRVLLRWTSDGTIAAFAVSGQAVATSASAGVPSAAAQLWSVTGVRPGADTLVCAVSLFGVALDADARFGVEAYYALKYGVQFYPFGGSPVTALSAAAQTGAWFTARRGPVELSVQGTFVGNVYLQRSLDAGTNFEDLDKITAPTPSATVKPSVLDVAADNVLLRWASKLGEWTSGTANCNFAQ